MSFIDADNRPWGRWEEYLNEPGYRVKRIVVFPGKRLSLQRHAHRMEHWVVVQGGGVFTLDGAERRVAPGDALEIPLGGVHRIHNDATGTGAADHLVIVETQMGLCIEDDIERLDDDFGRA